MVVVVTGASGHIGANLVRTLLTNGRPVRALVHRDSRALKGLDIETVNGDICDTESLFRAFNGAETVYHLAANISLMMNEWAAVQKINVAGTQNVIDACLKSNVKRLVYFSSIHAFESLSRNEIIDETCALVDSVNCPPYDRSKAAGERLVLGAIARGLDAVIINPTAVFGPYDYRPSHFGAVLFALAHKKMPALIAGGFDWVDARDVAEGAISAEKNAPSGSKYLLSGHYISVRDVAAVIEKITGVKRPQFVTPMWLARAVAPCVTAFNRMTGKRQLFTTVSLRALNNSCPVSHEKASRELGYQPRPFEQTVTDTLQWMEEYSRMKHNE